MIASLRPPYTITFRILKLISSVSEKLGAVSASYLQRQSPQLRKQNKIRTIHSTLAIEGNTLTESQITALLESKRVIGDQREVLEVLNAINVYENLGRFNPYSRKDFLKAHQLLMQGLVEKPGQYRSRGVGILQGSRVAHLAPSAELVRGLMKDLFLYLGKKEELALIKSCVFHYETEFIHPFLDGNGRMGRLWQTLILMKEYPVFEFLPLETLISKTQAEYYQALSFSDRSGNSTPFIEYMLNVIDQSLADLLRFNNRTMTDIERIEYFIALGQQSFTRKDYMDIFKDISSATASRDLKKALDAGLLSKSGDNNTTKYHVK